MRLFQIINAIPDDQKILFNVKGCTPQILKGVYVGRV